jgi:hypothetical protein
LNGTTVHFIFSDIIPCQCLFHYVMSSKDQREYVEISKPSAEKYHLSARAESSARQKLAPKSALTPEKTAYPFRLAPAHTPKTPRKTPMVVLEKFENPEKTAIFPPRGLEIGDPTSRILASSPN